MLDFETIYKKHGETLIWDLLDTWERDYRVRHPSPMTLEERWEHFIRATEVTASIAA
jgi:hypothetical protein